MKRKLIFVLICTLIIASLFVFLPNTAKADELSDSIKEQIENLDLTELENFVSNIDTINGQGFFDYLGELIKGEYNFSFSSITEYILRIFFSNVKNVIPIFISVIAIALFCGIINGAKGSFLSEGTADIIFFVCLSSIILLLSGSIISIFQNVSSLISFCFNLSKHITMYIYGVLTLKRTKF